MRIDAKPSTAGPNQRRARGLGRIFRGSFAGRGVSAGVEGSGAPFRRGRLAVVALALAVLTTALIAATALSKEAIIKFGGSGAEGGQFSAAGEVAVNRSGAGPADAGDLYVVDSNNHRVQRFDSEGNFISAWGADVALSDGGTDYEICTEAAECQAGAASGGNGTAAGNGVLNTPQGIAVDGDTGVVYISDRNNRRINAYDGEGGFLFSVGRDVAEPNGATVVEVCDGETEVCRQGDGGSGPGEIGSTTQSPVLGLAVSPPDGEAATGTIYLADSQNRRVNTYALDGTSPASFGSATEFATVQPRKVAVDSRGIVYASDSEDSAEIERYDSEDANGGGVGFLAPIAASFNETQTIQFTGGFSGRFTLSCPQGGGTATIFYTPQAAFFDREIRSGLEADCGTDDVEVFTPGPNPSSSATLTFAGDLEATDVPQTVCTPLDAGSCPVTTVNDGSTDALLPANHAQSPARAATATNDLAVDPDSDGAGPDEDVLYVARQRVDSVGGVDEVQQFGPGNDPGLPAAPGEDDERHGGGAGFTSLRGLDLDDVSGRLFAVNGNDVFVLSDPLPDPAPLMNPITVKTDSTATFSGTVDPQGGQVGCAFQYSTDQSNWTDVPASDCGSLSVGGGPQPVSEEVTGLDPNTTYFVRLRAFRPLDSSAPTATSPVTSFKTVAPPPVVSDVGAIQVKDTSARLVGTIDPRNTPTGYVFEYGTTPALGSSTAPLAIGDGTIPITVSQVVVGLTKDTTYYFRVVATNLAGATNSTVQTLQTRADPVPTASKRAYEMVSPPDKNEGGVDQKPAGRIKGGISADGEAAGFCTTSLFGEPPAQMTGLCAPYVSHRAPEGWQTTSPVPPHCRIDFGGNYANGSGTAFLSRDYRRAALALPETSACQVPPLDPAAPLGGNNLYRQDLGTALPGYRLTAPMNTGATFVGGDDDFSLIVYSSEQNQTAEPDSPPEGSFAKLYLWNEGSLELLSRDPAGEPFATPSRFPSRDNFPLESAVSTDGSRVYFHNEAPTTQSCNTPACHLYLREGGATTIEVSASECISECGPNGSAEEFMRATPDGAVAFFRSADKLTDESTAGGGKLYRWDRNAPPGNQLTDITLDEEPADGSTPGARDILGVGDDGETVYFVNRGQLVAGEPTGDLFEGNVAFGTDGDDKLYRWSWNGGNAALDFLGPFAEVGGPPGPGEVSLDYGGDEPNLDAWWSHVTPDGEYLTITTRLKLDVAADRDAHVDAYRWSEAEGWICVSCQLPGVLSAGEVNVTHTYLSENFNNLKGYEPIAKMSDDGKRVFFDTPDALLAADTNGTEGCPPLVNDNEEIFSYTCQDVYEWNDGTLSLVSPGNGDRAWLIGTSSDGRSVFFETPERLVGWDTGEGTDIYAARIGGGFPEPSAQPPECEGEGCRAAGTDAPEVAGAGTAVFQGAGNPKPEAQANRCPANRLRRGKRCLTVAAIARKRCRRLKGQAKRRCVRKQATHLRRAQRRAKRRAQRRNRAANFDRRAQR